MNVKLFKPYFLGNKQIFISLLKILNSNINFEQQGEKQKLTLHTINRGAG